MPASCTDRGRAEPQASGGTAAEAGTALAVDLFERYHEEVYGYLCGMVRDPAWAEDLAQETFLRVLRARRQLPGVQNCRAWLYRVATNVALNALKRRRRFAWLPWRAGDREVSAPDVAEQVAERNALEAALASLPAESRAPLLLYAQYGLSPAEVAAALGLSEAAARKRIYRATALFRQAFGKGDAR
ncbi:MAG TPA: RNA polymerase sigma factor [Anaerolineae bacterium]|nr:RNA polymerase sigma factor [Anaerolineae bacterium]HPL29053.1 RNA polymerase sigma factor [Anaerolineae bacterium]